MNHILFRLRPWEAQALLDKGVKPVAFDAPVDAVHESNDPPIQGVDKACDVGGVFDASPAVKGGPQRERKRAPIWAECVASKHCVAGA